MYQKIRNILLGTSEGPFFRDSGADDPYWEFPSLLGVTKEELDQIIINLNDLLEDEKVQTVILSSIGNLIAFPHRNSEALKKWTGMDKLELKKFQKLLWNRGWQVV